MQAAEVEREARAALAKSGTVTLELGVSGVPMITAYKVAPWEAAIASISGQPVPAAYPPAAFTGIAASVCRAASAAAAAVVAAAAAAREALLSLESAQ